MKNGRHPSGTQRWRCRECGASSIRRRPDVARREQLRRFLTWLTGKNTQWEAGGGTGIRSALARAWPDTVVQRCIFHLQMNVTRELTRNPRLGAGRALRQIAMQLGDVRDVDAAIAWRLILETWWQQFGHLTKERTLYDNGHFGFTHHLLRKAWVILHRAAEAGHVFTFLEHGNPRTTSPLEGGINAQIRHLLRHHRGMSIAHRRRAVEWFLLLKEVPVSRAHKHADPPPTAPPSQAAEEPDGPTLYDTGLDAGEGLWLRTGWAGRG